MLSQVIFFVIFKTFPYLLPVFYSFTEIRWTIFDHLILPFTFLVLVFQIISTTAAPRKLGKNFGSTNYWHLLCKIRYQNTLSSETWVIATCVLCTPITTDLSSLSSWIGVSTTNGLNIMIWSSNTRINHKFFLDFDLFCT